MISVIIPSKTLSNLLPCVAAVQANAPDASITVVWDAHSNNGYTPDVLKTINMVSVYEPFVFAHNVNVGIKANTDADGYLLLNDDAILKTPGGFSLLAQAAREHPEYGVISAATNNVGNLNQLPRGAGLREESRMVCFIAVYIPRTTVEKAGLLDETIGRGGFEDDDYCLRVRRAGLKIGIHDGCFVDHASLVSSFRGPGAAGYDPNAAANFKAKWGADNHAL